MRERNIGIPRPEDQMGCDERPNYYTFAYLGKFSTDQLDLICHIIQKMEHFHALIRNNQTSNRDLRVYYLTNQITKEQLKNAIIKRERTAMRDSFVNGVHQMIVDVMVDILRNILVIPNKFDTHYSELVTLCNNTNDLLLKYQKKHNLKTPKYNNSPFNLFENVN
jgi:hypothetical protein